MKITAYFICFLLFCSSCKKPCLSAADVTIEGAPVMKYFNTFKPFNWWIYENTDKSYKDSVYVKDYMDTVFYKSKTASCIIDSTRLMRLISTYFLKNTFNGNTSFQIKSTQFKEIELRFLANYIVDPVITWNHYTFSAYPTFKNSGHSFLDSIVLNGTIYRDIVELNGENFDKYYFAANIGMVGWRTNSPINTTFNLVNFKIH